MAREIIERRETGFYITGSRVPIDRIISEYHNGEDSEAIRVHYSTLSLGQVSGAIAFYQQHKQDVEQALEEPGFWRMRTARLILTRPISKKSSSACGGRQRLGESN